MARRIYGRGRISRRQKTWFWILATTAVVIGLLYWEQIALLYVLATTSMTLLLLVVAVSDLHSAHNVVSAPLTGDKTLASGDDANKTPTASTSTFGSRPRKRRR